MINGVAAGLTFQLKLCGLAGLVGSSPYWLYQIWAFILPGAARQRAEVVTDLRGDRRTTVLRRRGRGLLRPAEGASRS